MAGIGWKLERMIERGLARGDDRGVPDRRRGDLGAVAADDRVLISMRVLARGHAAIEFGRRRTVDHGRLRGHGRAVGAGPRRRVALRGRPSLRAAPPARRGSAAPRVHGDDRSASSVIGVVVMLVAGAPLTLAASRRAAHRDHRRAVADAVGGRRHECAGRCAAGVRVGALTSLIAAMALERAAGLGARGYLFGFAVGQGSRWY